MDLMLENILQIMKERNMSQKEFCDKMGMSPSLFTNWKRGLNNSYLKYAEKIAEILKVDVIDLYGIVYEKPLTLNENERTMIELYRKLNSRQQTIVYELIVNLSTGY